MPIKTSQQQDEIERKKQEDKIKYLYFSRYLMIRYIVAIFLFLNLIWLIILTQYREWLGIFISGITTLLSAISAVEQLTKMHNHKADVPLTRIYLWIQLIANVILSGCVFLPIKSKIFPFVNSNNSAYLILAILMVGIILAYVCEIRIHNILIGKDKYATAIDTFKRTNKKN